MLKANTNIRELARREKVPFWKIADKLGISEGTLVRWLRHELQKEDSEKIIGIIKELRKEAV